MRMFNLPLPEHLQAVAANALVWAFQQAHREETDQQRHGCRQAVALEWAATIRRKSHEVRDIAAGEQIGNHLEAALAGSLVSLLFGGQHIAIFALTLLHHPATGQVRSDHRFRDGSSLLRWP